jgi:hypothetical protein
MMPTISAWIPNVDMTPSFSAITDFLRAEIAPELQESVMRKVWRSVDESVPRYNPAGMMLRQQTATRRARVTQQDR